MTFQERIEELQGQCNKGSITDLDTVKDLINAYHLRGSVLTHLFKQAAHFRRLWRKVHIDPNQLGKLLTFIRKSTYVSIKMRKLK